MSYGKPHRHTKSYYYFKEKAEYWLDKYEKGVKHRVQLMGRIDELHQAIDYALADSLWLDSERKRQLKEVRDEIFNSTNEQD